MPAKQQKTSSNKLVALLQKDPKKASVLGVLVLVLGGMWVRLAMSGATSPAKASASIANPAAISNAKNKGLSAKARATSANTADALSEWLAKPITPISRNLFAVRIDNFPLATGKSGLDSGTAQQTFWDALAKSVSNHADQMEKRQNLIANLRTQASQMELQSIVMGAKPKALVDGELVGEGDVVASFRVLKIEPRRIIVEREGIRLEILMK
jgi:hypothetical protein